MRIVSKHPGKKQAGAWGGEQIVATWTYLRAIVDLKTAVVVLALSFGVLVALLWQADSVTTGLKNATREIIVTARVEIDRYFNPHQLPTMYIDMDFESFQRIRDKRSEALQLGQLYASDDDLVPAELRYMENSTVPVRMRLKGDMGDHWTGDKWSYRIHVLDGAHVAGMRRFSIQDPMTRQLINEWMFHQMLHKEDILTTRYSFVDVVFNGQFKGIYALEESFSEELLEAQGRPLGVILRQPDNPQGGTGSTLPFPEVYRGSSVARDPVLSSQAEAATKMLLDGEASEIYDNGRIGRMLALMTLWDGDHGAGGNNQRYYYNPITARLEPIGYDASPVLYPDETEVDLREIRSMNPLIARAYMREILQISETAHLEDFRAEISDQLDIFVTALRREYLSLDAPWQQLTARQDSLRQALSSQLYILATGEIRQQPVPQLSVHITNFSSFPVTLKGVAIDDKMVRLQMDWFLSNGQVMRSNEADEIILTPFAMGKTHSDARIDSDQGAVRFAIPLEKLELSGQFPSPTASLGILVRRPQRTKDETIPISITDVTSGSNSSPMPPMPTAEEFLSKHPFVSLDGDANALRVRPGDWEVQGDLVLPEDTEMIISPGTTLRFEEGAVFLARSRVDVRGTKDQPVVLTANRHLWGGVAIIEAVRESIWKHVLVEKTQGINRKGWVLTGGVTFYESPLTLDNVQIIGSKAEDAVNIIRSNYAFRNSEFGYSVSDAFDSDFSQGHISYCSFHDIGGDAIDVSGSELTLSFTNLSAVEDKAVSAGELSSVVIDNVSISEIGIGIASKDLSSVLVNGTTIAHAKHTALAAFVKKPEYGPATIDADELTIIDTSVHAMVQTNSMVKVNGVTLDTNDLNVDALYAQGVLGN